MSVLLIEEDNKAIVEAIKQKDRKRITSCIQNFYKKYPDDNTISSYKNVLDREEKDEFDHAYSVYGNNVKKGLIILNNYIKENIDNYLIYQHKKMFLTVVKTLVDINRLDIAGVDAERLCISFLQYLASAKREDNFQKTYEILTTPVESNELDQEGNTIFILWTEHVLGDRDFLPKILKKTYGKNYGYLKDIFTTINHIHVAEIDTKLSCVMHGECQRLIPSEKSYFIAFPFNYGEIENEIIEAFKDKFQNLQLKPRIARDLIEAGTVLCQICQLILSSEFGIYVLNEYSSDTLSRHLPNPNVMLELGLAIGRGKKFIILLEKGTAMPADLHGYLRIEYNNIGEIPKLISQHDFAAFYSEEN